MQDEKIVLTAFEYENKKTLPDKLENKYLSYSLKESIYKQATNYTVHFLKCHLTCVLYNEITGNHNHV